MIKSSMSQLPICKYWLKKKCHFGDRCRNRHVLTSKEDTNCKACHNGVNLSLCVTPKCDKCFYNTECHCAERFSKCICTECKKKYSVPLCQSCNTVSAIIATKWTLCLMCLEKSRTSDTSVDKCIYSCYLCLDGNDVSTCVIPRFDIKAETPHLSTIKYNLPGCRWNSSKVQCLTCQKMYNIPLCIICSKLSEPYSMFKYCEDCCFLTQKERHIKTNSPILQDEKLNREEFVKKSGLFEPNYVYTGKYVSDACGICFDGRNRKALALRQYYDGLRLTCLFCGVS
jgi:hypothetical protein